MKQHILTIIAIFLFSSTIQAQATMAQPVDIGSKTSSFTYTDTKNTQNYSNNFGQSSNEVYYKFTITQTMDVLISPSSRICSYLNEKMVVLVTGI